MKSNDWSSNKNFTANIETAKNRTLTPVKETSAESRIWYTLILCNNTSRFRPIYEKTSNVSIRPKNFLSFGGQCRISVLANAFDLLLAVLGNNQQVGYWPALLIRRTYGSHHSNCTSTKPGIQPVLVLVGNAGFEPATSTTSMWRSSQMS